MNQDGRPEHPTNTHPFVSTPDGGKILLTLCTKPEDQSPYRHAVVPFPASHQEACMRALKAFAAYIPPDVETVCLRQVVRRADGQVVWSIISEDEWEALLGKNGEEVGVFLPNIIPETVPYRKVYSPKMFVCFMCHHSPGTVHTFREVHSLEDCIIFKEGLGQKNGWTNFELFYDERMIGNSADQKLYRNRVDTPDQRPKWRPLVDAESFSFLLHLFPEPMWIYIELAHIAIQVSG